MALKKNTTVAPVPEEVKEVEVPEKEVKTKATKTKEVVAEVIPEPEVEPEKSDELALYIDPDDHIYEFKAGKTFSGLSAEDVFSVLSGLLGKVETIIIKRKS